MDLKGEKGKWNFKQKLFFYFCKMNYNVLFAIKK